MADPRADLLVRESAEVAEPIAGAQSQAQRDDPAEKADQIEQLGTVAAMVDPVKTNSVVVVWSPQGDEDDGQPGGGRRHSKRAREETYAVLDLRTRYRS